MSVKFVQVERVTDLCDRADDYFSPPETNEPKQKQTNADKIRSMNDHELADELLSLSAWPERAGAMYEKGAFESAYDAILWWLRQEADE